MQHKRSATLEVLYKQILADPCDADPLHTSAASVANLSELKMRIAIGSPCAAEFKTYRMPD